MQKQENDSLKTLVLEVFDKAAGEVETRLNDVRDDVVPEDLWADLLEEFPVLRFKDDPALKEELVGFLIAKGVLLTEDGEAEHFFLHILDKLEGRNSSHAYNNAALALRVLSKSYIENVELVPTAQFN